MYKYYVYLYTFFIICDIWKFHAMLKLLTQRQCFQIMFAKRIILNTTTYTCRCYSSFKTALFVIVTTLYTFIANANFIWPNHLINLYQKTLSFGGPRYNRNSNSSAFDSGKAVDGKIDTFSEVQERIHSVWWRVRLNRYHTVTDINITMDTGTYN